MLVNKTSVHVFLNNRLSFCVEFCVTFIFILNLQIKEFLKMEAKKLKAQKDESYFDDVVADVFHKNDHDADGTLSLKEYNIYNHDEL